MTVSLTPLAFRLGVGAKAQRRIRQQVLPRLGTLVFLLLLVVPAAASWGVDAYGTRGYQLFNNTVATTEESEETPCGLLGSSAIFVRVRVETNGFLRLDTIGSQIETILAVYSQPNDFSPFTFVTCDANSAPDGLHSLVTFPAQTNVNYLIAIDGRNGARGVIALNFCFGVAPVITAQPQDQFVLAGDPVT